MPQKKPWLIVSFASTTEALTAERLFTQANIGGALIPTPRSLSASCGLCWRADPLDKPAIEAQLTANRLRAENIVELLM